MIDYIRLFQELGRTVSKELQQQLELPRLAEELSAITPTFPPNKRFLVNCFV
jgi:hypothetical protein